MLFKHFCFPSGKFSLKKRKEIEIYKTRKTTPNNNERVKIILIMNAIL